MIRVISLNVTRACWRVDVKLHSFLILALDEIIDQLHTPDAFPPIKQPSLFIVFEAGWTSEAVRTFRTIKKLLSSSL